MSETDWSNCPDVERIPAKVSGQWIVRGTRILADSVIENVAAGVTLDQLVTDPFPTLGIDLARRIVEYARERAARREALDELARLGQEMGIGYEP